MIPLTPWVRRLLAANVAIHLVGLLPGMRGELLGGAGAGLLDWFVFVPSALLERPWSFVTYAFLHADFWHLAFNMIGLFFFGPRLEERLGSRRFLALYLLAATGGAVFHFASQLLEGGAPVIGASGSVYGVLVSFAMFWPRARIYLWAILPVQAWLLATVLVFASLYSGLTAGYGSTTAHLAHFGGVVFAFAYVKLVGRSQAAAKRKFQDKMTKPAPATAVQARAAAAAWLKIDLDSLHSINREEVERLQDKLRKRGPGALTISERATLDRMAREG